MKHGSVEHHSKALKRIKTLISDNIDLSQIGLPDANTHCAGLQNKQAPRYSKIDPRFCMDCWNYSEGVLRSQQCPESTHLDAELAVGMERIRNGTNLFWHIKPTEIWE